MSTTTMSGWLGSSCLSLWNSPTALVFSATFGGVSHQDLESSSSYVALMFLYASLPLGCASHCMLSQPPSLCYYYV